MEEVKQLISSLIAKQQTLHVNDLAVYAIWDEMTEVLSKDMLLTITYMEGLSEEELVWVSQVIPDIMEKTNDKQYLLFLKSLQKSYPTQHAIDTAINYYREEEWTRMTKKSKASAQHHLQPARLIARLHHEGTPSGSPNLLGSTKKQTMIIRPAKETDIEMITQLFLRQ